MKKKKKNRVVLLFVKGPCVPGPVLGTLQTIAVSSFNSASQ